MTSVPYFLTVRLAVTNQAHIEAEPQEPSLFTEWLTLLVVWSQPLLRVTLCVFLCNLCLLTFTQCFLFFFCPKVLTTACWSPGGRQTYSLSSPAAQCSSFPELPVHSPLKQTSSLDLQVPPPHPLPTLEPSHSPNDILSRRHKHTIFIIKNFIQNNNSLFIPPDETISESQWWR